MGEERIELEKIKYCSLSKFSCPIFGLHCESFKDAEYTSQTIAILYLLHFVSFTLAILPIVFIAEAI